MKCDDDVSVSQDSRSTAPPTVQVLHCSYNNLEYCSRHSMKGVWTTISTKIWKDRGKGRGFGYVKIKKKVLRCNLTKPNKSPASTDLLTTWLKSGSTNKGGDHNINMGGGKGSNSIGQLNNLPLCLTNKEKEQTGV